MKNPYLACFENRIVRADKLLAYGFEPFDGAYRYQKPLDETGLTAEITVTAAGEVSAMVMDAELGEPYTLLFSKSASGSFVGGVRFAYEELLCDIAKACFDEELFHEEQSKRLIAYIRSKYEREPEFLWEKFPRNAVWRRGDNAKWFGALLTVSARKLGIDSDEILEVLDLRMRPEEADALMGRAGYYPGYHMNKKHWFSVLLDGSLPFDEVCRRVEESYCLAKKKSPFFRER